MWKRHFGFSISFGLIALLELFTEILNIQEIRIMLKPVICILLLGYLISKTRLYGTFSKLIFFGLLFSLVGDISLIFAKSSGTFFLVGLGAFVLAHLFYSIAFFRDYRYDTGASKKYGNMMIAVMFVSSISFSVLMQPYLKEMMIPVTIYILVISVTAILAGFRFERVNLGSFRMILSGVVLFIISNILFAADMFVTPFGYSSVLIMATYMLAQYLITIGTLERKVEIK